MDNDQTAIVIGGGLIGCSVAYYLGLRGWRVRLLERDTIGSGASHGNCGFVCPSHAMPLSGPGVIGKTIPSLLKFDAPLAIPLRIDPMLWNWLFRFSRECSRQKMLDAAAGRAALLGSSMQLYKQLLDTGSLNCEWTDRGLLLVYHSQREFEEFSGTAELISQKFSVEAKRYERDEVKELEPALRRGLAGGWHFPDDSHVRPDKLMSDLRRLIEEQGGEILEDAELRSMQIEGGVVERVFSNRGEHRADTYVLATGAEAPAFSKYIGVKIPIQPGKGYSLTMAPLATQPQIPMIFEQHHVAVTPFDGAFRIGSTMEFAGYDRKINRRRIALLRKSAELHLESPIPSELDEQWSGWRPMVYDGLPCIGRAPAANNLIVAAGNGMIGLATAPATGKLVAEIANNEAPHLDPTPYAPSRFL